jgi:hypothetical protein
VTVLDSGAGVLDEPVVELVAKVNVGRGRRQHEE